VDVGDSGALRRLGLHRPLGEEDELVDDLAAGRVEFVGDRVHPGDRVVDVDLDVDLRGGHYESPPRSTSDEETPPSELVAGACWSPVVSSS
jgi:hypothetical protein